MTADDLTAPLGTQPDKRRRSRKLPIPQIVAGALALFLGVFVLWAVVADDPFGGEPMAVAPADVHVIAKTTEIPQSQQPSAAPDEGRRRDAQAGAPPGAGAPANAAANTAAKTTTVTIIDGKTGERQEVQIPAPAEIAAVAASKASPVEQKLLETTPQGAIPKIAADGTHPSEAYARPVQPLPGKPDAPRIAIIVSGLGVSERGTAAAIAALPGAVTLGFVPYGIDVASLVARARAGGHEVLLQVPMEPFDYPDNDPGPQTLLTSLTPEQNIDRLHTLMSRFQGYVGLANTMGARFTASEPSLGPILHETAKRGLIFVDDGSNARSIAGRIATANNLPFAQADVILDAVPTPAEIDRNLSRLEMTARERGVAVGISSSLPVALDHIAKWANAAASHGLLVVPISAVAIKAKQS